jgi:hypothetical protein
MLSDEQMLTFLDTIGDGIEALLQSGATGRR